MTDATATTVAKDSQATGPSALETVRIALHTPNPGRGEGWNRLDRYGPARHGGTRTRRPLRIHAGPLVPTRRPIACCGPCWPNSTDCRPWRGASAPSPHGRPEIDPACGIAPRAPFQYHPHPWPCRLRLDGGRPPADLEFGVDAECLERSPDALALAERFCSAREAAWLGSLPPEARQGEFLRLWTLKEAVAKATGLGLHLD
ncbi:4'-phosphopantetheinyl transferase superfamily protein, partial [Methylomagnum ishizawai]